MNILFCLQEITRAIQVVQGFPGVQGVGRHHGGCPPGGAGKGAGQWGVGHGNRSVE